MTTWFLSSLFFSYINSTLYSEKILIVNIPTEWKHLGSRKIWLPPKRATIKTKFFSWCKKIYIFFFKENIGFIFFKNKKKSDNSLIWVIYSKQQEEYFEKSEEDLSDLVMIRNFYNEDAPDLPK